MKTSRGILILLLLLTGAFSLATWLQPRSRNWTSRAQSDSIWKIIMGDSRRIFARHFYVKADVSFHSGFYPSIFDQSRRAEEEENAVAHEGEHSDGDHDEHPRDAAKTAEAPKDWIARFGSRFKITEHTHLEGEQVREILPWLRISTELDPHRIETYTVASFWLRTQLKRIDEAEQFLREGIQANPDSYELLYELGRLQQENRNDNSRARNLWQLALRRWHEKEGHEREPNYVAFEAITIHLAKLEEHEGNPREAIKWMEMAKPHSPHPEQLQQHIETLRARL